MPKAIRDPGRVYTCAWCKQRKPIAEMRTPGSSRGKTPSTCWDCRLSNPGESWCDFHGGPHPIDRFRDHGPHRPGVRNECRDGYELRISRGRAMPPRTCLSCGVDQESWQFRGGRQKSPICRDCQGAHPRERWCVDCAAWLSDGLFHRTGVDGKFWTVRCKPCKVAHAHGTTVAQLLRLQESARPECGACQSVDHLKVDHDHDCCPAEQSCGRCVRGYLCHECNTAEGLLRTPERALALAAYMQREARRNVA